MSSFDIIMVDIKLQKSTPAARRISFKSFGEMQHSASLIMYRLQHGHDVIEMRSCSFHLRIHMEIGLQTMHFEDVPQSKSHVSTGATNLIAHNDAKNGWFEHVTTENVGIH